MAESAQKAADSTTGFDLWGRVGYVEITTGKYEEPLKFIGLDYKFKVEKTLGNFAKGSVEVSILGLSQETINKIVTVCSMDEALKMGKRVRVYAGYEGMESTNPNYQGDLIIDADISYAKVDTPPPEMWVSIVGIIGYRYHFNALSMNLNMEEKETKTLVSANAGGDWVTKDEVVKITKHTYYELCQKVVEKINECSHVNNVDITTELDFRASDAKKNAIVESFVFTGAISELVEMLGEQGDCCCFIEHYTDRSKETLVVMDTIRSQVDRGGKQDKTIDTSQINKNRRYVRHKKLNKDTGMIGIPSIVHTCSLRCRCLLDPKLTIGDYIDITSDIMPCVNGDKWQILSIKHTGHFRGNEWYTDITAVDPSRIKKQIAGNEKNPNSIYGH